MNLILYTHPGSLGSWSHRHFARWLAEGLRARGHAVAVRQPDDRLWRAWGERPGRKWVGYVDQYIRFPAQLKATLVDDPPHALHVFCDQALGPWIPLVADRPHVVHCHDLLALRSALGEWPENPTRLTGRIYQRWIRRGFRCARHFVSISERTRRELHRLGGVDALTSEVVYNGLNHPYRPLPEAEARAALHAAGLLPRDQPLLPFLLHVSGGQWYKNRRGVLALHAAHAGVAAAAGTGPWQLWLVGPPLSAGEASPHASLPAGAEIRRFDAVDPAVLQALYSLAQALLFPSHAEGFGWPIAEALACGCPVLTTNEAPMTEVGGPHATYLRRLGTDDRLEHWANEGAIRLAMLLARSPAEREAAAAAGVAWARRFDSERTLDGYLAIYERVLAHEAAAGTTPLGRTA